MSSSIDAFERVARNLDSDLFEAALVIAVDEYKDLDCNAYLEQMAILCEGFDIFREGETDPLRLLDRLADFFFHDLGFRGNSEDYYNPRNSYVNDVLDRRLGIPISLSVVYMGIARSAGLRLEGINFPGHFLLSLSQGANKRIYIDVFNQGRTLHWDDCLRRFPLDAESSKPEESGFPAMTEREILLRMLRNLKGIYSRGDLERCVRVQRRICRLAPHDADEKRDLGFLYFHAGKPALAVRELRALIDQFPHAQNQKMVQEYLAMAAREAASLN